MCLGCLDTRRRHWEQQEVVAVLVLVTGMLPNHSDSPIRTSRHGLHDRRFEGRLRSLVERRAAAFEAEGGGRGEHDVLHGHGRALGACGASRALAVLDEEVGLAIIAAGGALE